MLSRSPAAVATPPRSDVRVVRPASGWTAGDVGPAGDPPAPEAGGANEGDPPATHRRDAFARFLRSLPRLERTVLLLRHTEELTPREIAMVLDQTEARVTDLLDTLDQTIRRLFRRPDGDDDATTA